MNLWKYQQLSVRVRLSVFFKLSGFTCKGRRQVALLRDRRTNSRSCHLLRKASDKPLYKKHKNIKYNH